MPDIDPIQRSVTLMNERNAYEKAWVELEEGKKDEGIWAMAYVKSEGDNEKTKLNYLKLRVADLLGNDFTAHDIIENIDHDKNGVLPSEPQQENDVFTIGEHVLARNHVANAWLPRIFAGYSSDVPGEYLAYSKGTTFNDIGLEKANAQRWRFCKRPLTVNSSISSDDEGSNNIPINETISIEPPSIVRYGITFLFIGLIVGLILDVVFINTLGEQLRYVQSDFSKQLIFGRTTAVISGFIFLPLALVFTFLASRGHRWAIIALWIIFIFVFSSIYNTKLIPFNLIANAFVLGGLVSLSSKNAFAWFKAKKMG